MLRDVALQHSFRWLDLRVGVAVDRYARGWHWSADDRIYSRRPVGEEPKREVHEVGYAIVCQLLVLRLTLSWNSVTLVDPAQKARIA